MTGLGVIRQSGSIAPGSVLDRDSPALRRARAPPARRRLPRFARKARLSRTIASLLGDRRTAPSEWRRSDHAAAASGAIALPRSRSPARPDLLPGGDGPPVLLVARPAWRGTRARGAPCKRSGRCGCPRRAGSADAPERRRERRPPLAVLPLPDGRCRTIGGGPSRIAERRCAHLLRVADAAGGRRGVHSIKACGRPARSLPFAASGFE